ncbi:hypothetical protein RND81_11G005500 [Saponaria officinalis]|uniref:Caffeoyl-CoA O-methyltransferase n=1 Tax=Saponaria officinalis TaxID=3572 RepID=A0AAW1HGB0_SAPOF
MIIELIKSEISQMYILKTSAFPKEDAQLKEIREATLHKYNLMSIMSVSVDEAQFISMLLKIMNAQKTLELGVFTGYSLLATALALPQHGKIVAIDVDDEAYELGLPFIKKAGVDHKIQFIKSDGIPALSNLLQNEEEQGSYDFAFIDADKENYIKYHEQVLKLVKVGGIIAYDNTLWFGSVAHDENGQMPEWVRKKRPVIIEFNDFLANDSRVESTILSIGDGLTLCRRLI